MFSFDILHEEVLCGPHFIQQVEKRKIGLLSGQVLIPIDQL